MRKERLFEQGNLMSGRGNGMHHFLSYLLLWGIADTHLVNIQFACLFLLCTYTNLMDW